MKAEYYPYSALRIYEWTNTKTLQIHTIQLGFCTGSKAFLASGGTLEMNFVGQCHGPSQNDVSGLGLLLL